MTGFAASCYCRGVDFIQVPTTLLAQVDSSIGGKTGINYLSGKNLIGSFHHPKCVIIDTNTLNTLPDREFNSALAEVLKYSLIADAEFFTWIENNIDNVLTREHSSLNKIIKKSCQTKAQIVAADEKEHGVRTFLNLGHTFGHALESATHYKKWLHGEAVGLGIRLAVDMSIRLNWLQPADGQRINTLLDKIYLPSHIPETLSTHTLIEHMQLDKKIINKKIRLVLLQEIGKAIITQKFSQDDLQKTIETARLYL